MSVAENYKQIRAEVPEHVTIVAAAKTRTKEELIELIEAGATDIGQNYVQEAVDMYTSLPAEIKSRVRWHMIGNLQKNKINKVLDFCDLIQTVDSYEKAVAIDKRALAKGHKVAVYIEVNIGDEEAKDGIPPDYEILKDIVERVALLENINLEGLMTMGPFTMEPEELRPYFRQVKEMFDRINELKIEGGELKTLSMGMSGSYKVAIEEGSNMIRLGTILFGARNYNK